LRGDRGMPLSFNLGASEQTLAHARGGGVAGVRPRFALVCLILAAVARVALGKQGSSHLIFDRLSGRHRHQVRLGFIFPTEFRCS